MKKYLLLYIMSTLHSILISAQSQYPVDISYLIADVKYSQEHGLKICEVQHGSLSALDGDLFISGSDGTIAPMIADFFALFSLRKWASGLIYSPLKRSLAAQGWKIKTPLKTLLDDPIFLEYAALRPADPFSITSYAGIIYADFDVVRNFDFYRKAYPNIIFINAATLPYWRDKYIMNALFDLNDDLKQYKADWRLYPKKYDPLLSERIQHDLPAELYVIKPRSEALANGVIVAESKDLDSVLHMILEPSAHLAKHSDKKYAYWWKNNDDTFILEKHYRSDFLCLPLAKSENRACTAEYHYDATLRFVCIMQYDGGKMSYYCPGAFWKLPSKALEEKGTLNEKRISCCRPPFYSAVDPTLLHEASVHMERAMLLLYEIMLNRQSV